MFNAKELAALIELINRVELKGHEAVMTGHLLQKLHHFLQRETAEKTPVEVREDATEE